MRVLARRNVANRVHDDPLEPSKIVWRADKTDPATDYLRDLLKDTRTDLNLADSKAAVLLASSGVAVGALLAGLLGRGWTPLDLDVRVQWLWWLGVCSAACGIFLMAATIYPRIYRRNVTRPEMPTFYWDVAAFKDVNEFRYAIQQTPNAQERLIDQTFLLSHIVARKYVLLRYGLCFLFTAIIACTLSVLVNILLS